LGLGLGLELLGILEKLVGKIEDDWRWLGLGLALGLGLDRSRSGHSTELVRLLERLPVRLLGSVLGLDGLGSWVWLDGSKRPPSIFSPPISISIDTDRGT